MNLARGRAGTVIVVILNVHSRGLLILYKIGPRVKSEGG